MHFNFYLFFQLRDIFESEANDDTASSETEATRAVAGLVFAKLLTNFLRASYKRLTGFCQTFYELFTNFL